MTAITAVAAGLFLLMLLVDLDRARGRLRRWPVLPPGYAPPLDVRVFVAPGVVLDPSVQSAALAYLSAHNIEAIDLVPADLDIAAALEIAAVADSRTLSTDPFARTAGAGHVVIARADLVERARLAEPRDMASVAAAAETLRRFAVGRTRSFIAPGLASVVEAPPARAAIMRARTGVSMAPLLYAQGFRWALLLVAAVTNPGVGAGLVVAASLLPSLAFAGLPLRPRDRLRSLIERVPSDLVRWARAIVQRDPRGTAIDAERPVYRDMMREGTAHFFSPRRDFCPVCGDRRLVRRLVTTDLLQRKPGQFTLDRCGACGIIFQNPPLSSQGLDFYYRDFYDGLNADVADELFASTHRLYTSRIQTIAATRGASKPARWLDVGCGYAHFSLEGQRRLPTTRFEGLDRSESVDVALARGWISRAWKQGMNEVADAGERFDVVSLFHYLEHTQHPADEIRAAARLLTDTGCVTIEIPNPRCWLGNLLGRWWFPWFQPQHQHLLNEAAVRRLLVDAGLESISVTYLMTAGDFFLATVLAVRRVCSAGDVPWAPRPGSARLLLDPIIWGLACPIFIAALLMDVVYARLPSSPMTSNALRVVAARRR